MTEQTKKQEAQMRTVITGEELENGLFRIGSRYHIRTPTYQYAGTLEAVTGTVFMFSDTATVYDTGPYPQFYGSGGRDGADVQPHVGAGELIVDRGGTVLHRLLK